MAKIADFQGNQWGLMASKDAMGRTYVRAYQNKWDAQKGRSYVAAKVQVGRLLDDGSIRLSPNFLLKFPDYADSTWYWGDHELLSEKDYNGKFYPPSKNKDTSWSNDIVRVGATWAAWKVAERMGLLEDLSAVFDKETAQTLLALAIYKLDGGGAMMNFEDWLSQVWLPNVEPLDGRRLTEILQTVDHTLTDKYYLRRYQRSTTATAAPLTLSFDSTSISTYSTTIKDAAYGYAKQNPELKQVNYMVVCDHNTGDVVYAYSYDGSINDKTILSSIYYQMQTVGIDLTTNILVTDRGFQSILNTQNAINLQLKYIQFLSLTEGGVRAQLRRNLPALTHPIACRDPYYQVSAKRVSDVWTENCEGVSTKIEAHLHLYRNARVAEEDTNDLFLSVQEVLKAKNDGMRRIRALEKECQERLESVKDQNDSAKKKVIQKNAEDLKKLKETLQRAIDPELWRRTKRFLHENKRARASEDVWSIKLDELSEAVQLFGCHAIRTNAISDPIEALRIYRQRQIIEEGFRQLKHEVGGARFASTESTYRGKLFVYGLAQAIRMNMLHTARKQNELNNKLQLPEESLRKTLLQLQGVMAVKHTTTDAFVTKAIPKRYRDLFEVLGVEKPPKTMYR